MTLRTILICALLTTMLFTGFGLAAAQQQEIDIQGEPDLEVYVPDNTFTPGETSELTLQVDNEGEVEDGQETNRELVTAARNVVIDVDADDTPITVTTNKKSLGTVTENQPVDAPFSIEIPDDAQSGTYEIDVEIDYRYTSRVYDTSAVTAQSEKSSSDDFEIEIEITDDARFRVTDINSTLRVGEEGDITG